MEKLPNIEKIKNDVNDLLNQFFYQHQFYSKNDKTSSPEYTKNLRKIYNQINTEIDKLRVYNNEIEKINREIRINKKGETPKEKKQVGRKKKTQTGGNVESQFNQILTQNNNKSAQNNIKQNPFVKFDTTKNINNDYNADTLMGLTEFEPQTKHNKNNINNDDNIINEFNNYINHIKEYNYNSTVEFNINEIKPLKQKIKDFLSFIDENYKKIVNNEEYINKFMAAKETHNKMYKNIKKQYKI